jgi:hypothetical protein
MKILIEKNPKNWTTDCSCDGCHSTFCINDEDIRYESDTDMDGDDVHFFYVKCPVCNWGSRLKISGFPKVVLAPAMQSFHASKMKVSSKKKSNFNWYLAFVFFVLPGLIMVFWALNK